jgi:hypothetical protein
LKDLLVRLDGSDGAWSKLDVAIEHARANGCGVHVLHERIGPPGRSTDAAAADVLSGAVTKLRHAGVPFSGEILVPSSMRRSGVLESVS